MAMHENTQLSTQETLYETVRDTTLPKEITPAVAAYEQLIGNRSRFVWKWLCHLSQEVSLDCVPTRYEQDAHLAKQLLFLFTVSLNDIAETVKDYATVREATNIPFAHRDATPTEDIQNDYLWFVKKVWDDLETRLQAAPRYDDFRDIFQFDIRMQNTALEFSMLLNELPSAANLSELQCYSAHNMVMVLQADIDLMYSPDVVVDDLGAVRETVWQAQQLGAIGNWLTTWERELEENDFTSGVIAYAISEGIVSPDELAELSADDMADLVEANDIEEWFLQEWRERYEDLRHDVPTASSVDLRTYLASLETLLQHQQAARGSK